MKDPDRVVGRQDGLLLALLVTVGLALRLCHPGSDPPLALSSSYAEIMDGPWYIAEAADGARGLPTDVPSHYRKPIFTELMRIGFRGGVGLERAHAMAAATGALLVLLGAGAAHAAFGTRAALVTAFLLATGFVPVGYGRTVVVWGPLATGLAGVLWLFACGFGPSDSAAAGGRKPAWRTAAALSAWLLLLALTFWLQAAAVVLAPALAIGHVVAARRRGRAIALAALIGGLALLTLESVDPQLLRVTLGKAAAYFGAVDPLSVLKRWLRAPFASGLWLRAPVIGALGWAGVLASVGEENPARPRQQRGVEVGLAASVVIWVSTFSLFEYVEGGPPPLRYFLPGLVPAATLAGGLLDRLTRGGIAWSAPRPLLFLWATLAAYWGIGTSWTGAWRALAPGGSSPPAWLLELVSFRFMIAMSLTIGAILALAAPPRPRGRPLRVSQRVVGAVLLTALAVDAPLLYRILARPNYSLREANRTVARLLAPGAALFGPFAHALTYDAAGVSRHLDSLDLRTTTGLLAPKARGCTHLAMDAGRGPLVEDAYRRIGVPLVPIAQLEVRGSMLSLYRFAWAEEISYRLSPLERELRGRDGWAVSSSLSR